MMIYLERASLILSVFILTIVGPGNAGTLASTVDVDIYAVNVDVSDDSASERQKASSKALKTIYRRATGSARPLVEYPYLNNYITKASRYLSTYAYETEDRQSTPVAEDPGNLVEAGSLEGILKQQPTTYQQLVAKLRFDQQAVKQHLRLAKAPHWATRRPKLETILVVKSQDELELVSAGSSQGDVLAGIEYHTENLGLPGRLGLARTLRANDIWAASPGSLRRQIPDGQAALVGKLEPTEQTTLEGRGSVNNSEAWQARWVFIWGDILYTEQLSANSQWALIGKGFEIAQQQFAARLANRLDTGGATMQNARQLVIEGVDTPKRYFDLIDHLDSLEVMKGYVIHRTVNQTVSLTFYSQLSPSRLQKMLTLDKRLLAMDDQAVRFAWR